ncbi:hypothetical protein [Streptomyces spiramenti]|uniref:hypothetical protein n=1 Tax=Streptomyces spiramenti TaxID=2720606 RepID=UPI001FD7D6CF|nr:hypothetical protein [Streptomyces spiramenti]
MGSWWDQDIVEAGKLPLLFGLTAFLVTFAVTRTVTRMIRAGRGPFGDISAGGVHLHHAVPGVVLMVAGGFGAIASAQYGPGAAVAAIVFGVGAGLVLDEFALIVYLQDVYWSEQGRRSVEMVTVTGAVVLLVLVGSAPFGVDTLTTEERQDRVAVMGTVVFHFACSAVAFTKGKPLVAVFGVLLPLVSLFGAVRLARPESPWARRFYRRRPRALARARRRAARHDRRWSGPVRRLQDLLGGTPTPELADRTSGGADHRSRHGDGGDGAGSGDGGAGGAAGPAGSPPRGGAGPPG